MKVNENHFINTNGILGAMYNFRISLYSSDNILEEFIENFLSSFELEKETRAKLLAEATRGPPFE